MLANRWLDALVIRWRCLCLFDDRILFAILLSYYWCQVSTF